MRECVEQFSEGRNAWQLGVLGFFLRLRGMIPTLIITFLTMGVPFWWPAFFTETVVASFSMLFIGSATLSGFSLLGTFVYIKHRSNRSLEIKSSLHTLGHEIRNEQSKIYSRTSKPFTGSPSDEDVRLYEYFDRLSNFVSDYFKSQINNKGIAAGIRLAKESASDQSTKIVYSTFGRSSGLNSKRAETSEDIPSNEGLPRFLIEKKCQGILIYNDIEKATSLNAFKKTVNDTNYKDEIVTMMVAPLNAWDGSKPSMIGILYVTSRKRDTFKAKHVDAMRFAADLVSSSVAFTVNTLKNGDRIKDIKKRQS
jgi:hypothetical protein